VAKHFELTITDDAFRFRRNTAALAAEAALDGFYERALDPPHLWASNIPQFCRCA